MKQPGVRWTIAALLVLGLFWMPIVNGVVGGALAAWHTTDRAKAIQTSVWISVVLALPLWAIYLYGAVWNPFAMIGGFWRMMLTLIAFIGTTVVVSIARTTRAAI